MSLESNPYAAPEAAISDATNPPALADYTPTQIKKLYYRSCNVGAIAALLIFATLSVGAGLVYLFAVDKAHLLAVPTSLKAVL